MDEGAFIDSLLAPDMRAASASVVVAAAPMVAPMAAPLLPYAPEFSAASFVGDRRRPGSRRRRHYKAADLLLQQPQGPPLHQVADDTAAPSADMDDSLFRQLMAGGGGFGIDADEAGSQPPLSTSSARSFQMTLAALAAGGSAAKDSAVENPPTSTNSLMFEPLELPRGGISAPLDQSFKDAFGAPVALDVVDDGADSPVVSPPNSACSLRSLAAVFQGDPCSTPRSPVSSDPSAMMPVQPLSSGSVPLFFASSGMPTSQAFASNGVSFSVAPSLPGFWMNAPSTASSSGMDGFDSTSPPGSMRQMLLMASGIVSPPTSTGSSVAGQFSCASLPSASLFTQQQQQQAEQWTAFASKAYFARALQTPTAAVNTAKRGKKRARAPGRQASALPQQLSILVPSMTPTSSTDKQLIVSAGVHGKGSDAETAARSSRKTKRAHTSRVRSPSAVSPMAVLTPTASPSGSCSDGDGSSTARPLKGKKCVEPGCIRRAQSNSRCKAHGGGARCQFAGPGGCARSSQGGGFCRAHGGGKRCEFPGCVRGQQRKGRCYVHGGIRRCQWAGCEKKDRGNGFCISHGGGKRCEREGCVRAVRRGSLCQLHDGSRQEE